jgi:hypothetical protein
LYLQGELFSLKLPMTKKVVENPMGPNQCPPWHREAVLSLLFMALSAMLPYLAGNSKKKHPCY